MKRIILFIMIFSHILAFGQDRVCISNNKMNTYLDSNPQAKQKRKILENKIKISSNKATSLTIPVVVHIVYKNNNENISDMQIQSQIDVLNKDFTHTNTDAINTPIGFVSNVGNLQIDFCLAKQTPNGQATNGIVRKQTTKSFFPVYGHEIHFDSTGGSNAWDSQKYLNIWVCKVQNGFLGWGQFPGAGIDATDGIVIDFEHFGTTGTAIAPYNLGRTATHELGHWFNLLHVWGDNTCGDDMVFDTPVQEQENYGCEIFPHNPNSCGTNNSNGDMFMNFMDYTNDACMNMFTEGQKSRVWSTIYNYRLGLLTSNGCQNISIPNSDAGIMDIIDPNNMQSCGNPVYPKVVLKNYATTTLNTAVIKYKIDTSNYQYQQWSGNLQANETDTISLAGINTNYATSHTFITSTMHPNNSIDVDTTNDNYTLNYTSPNSQLVGVRIITDNYGHETSWKLIRNNGSLIQTEDNLQSNTIYNHDICLPVGCYTFIAYDSFGDGFCCNYGNGGYHIDFKNGVTIANGGQFTFTDSVTFCIGNVTSIQDINSDMINIYPNPTFNNLYLNENKLFKNSSIFAKVFNSMGQLVLEKNWGDRNPISLAQYEDGLYLIQVETKNKIYSKRIILRK
ncbi:MAG: M43 family zinc metalloprotease [Bacteroidota bacterium]|nr:M43 family zinc metalloprotease [Bacteroidota bacterium]